MKKRLQDIVRELRVKGHLSIAELATGLDVSEETVRRDLKVLSREGLVNKHHGSASLADYRNEPTLGQRIEEYRTEKAQIAQLVAQSINDGDVVFLDIGSTTAFVAEALRSHRDLTIVTNSVVIANITFAEREFKTYLTGGEVRPHDGGMFGPDAHDLIKRYCINKAVLSTAGIHHAYGFLTHHLCEAELYSEVARQSEVVMICAESGKYNKRAPIKLLEFQEADILFSNAPPPKALRKELEKSGVDLRLLHDVESVEEQEDEVA